MRWTQFCISIALLSLAACSKTEYPKVAENQTNLPDAGLDDATIILTQNGIQQAVVKAEHVDRWDVKDSTEATAVNIVLYDSTGVEHSILTSKRGLLREQSAKFALFGDVVGVSKDSTVLKTQSLYWDPRTENVSTEDYVEIKRKDGDLIRGWGLKADRDLRNIEITRDVSGQVKKLPQAEPPKPVQKDSVANADSSHR